MNKKISILFVDDEPNILDGLRRLFYSMKNEWDIFYVSSGKDALKLMEAKEIDLIFSDMKMPEMDGAVLLEEIKKRKPGTIRIILSGHSDKDLILRASKSAHQFLAKPCNADIIKATIRKVIYLKKYIQNRSLITIIGGVEELPCIPELYFELEREINSSRVSLKKISDIVSQDVTMTAKILQLVNSAFFGLPQPVSNILQAINYLGLDMVKSLVLFVKIFNLNIIKETKFNINKFWNHSLRVARISQEIALKETSNKMIAEKAFIAGLLHDIGKLVILKIPGYVHKISELKENENLTFHEAEYKFFNTSHAEVGAYLLGLWGFPEEIIEAIAYHHSLPKSGLPSNTAAPMIMAVHLADRFTNSCAPDNEFIEKFKLNEKLNEYRTIAEKIEGYEPKNIIC